jgi:hypothetical protein
VRFGRARFGFQEAPFDHALGVEQVLMAIIAPCLWYAASPNFFGLE